MKRFLSAMLLPKAVQIKGRLESSPVSQAALYQAAKWAYRFSPLVALDSPLKNGRCPLQGLEAELYKGLNLDITASIKLFGGESSLLKRFKDGLDKLDLACRIAIAPTIGCAWAVSRFGDKPYKIIPNSSLREALSALPLMALRLDSDTLESLKEVNILSIKDLFGFARNELSERFGSQIIKRLDQATGTKEELISPLRYSRPLKVKREFVDYAADTQTLVFICRELFEELFTQAAALSKRISRLVVEITPQTEPVVSQAITLSLPSLNKEHIWHLLETRLETLRLNSPLKEISLLISNTEDFTPHTQNLFEASHRNSGSADIFGEMLDTLREHLGPEALRRIETIESHFPEKSFSFSPLPYRNGSPSSSKIIDAERPTILFPSPRRISTISTLPDYRPQQISWKGRVYPIISAYGPERVAPSWWGKDETLSNTRDYFRIELSSGLWLWIFRELESSKWFVHGIWA